MPAIGIGRWLALPVAMLLGLAACRVPECDTIDSALPSSYLGTN